MERFCLSAQGMLTNFSIHVLHCTSIAMHTYLENSIWFKPKAQTFAVVVDCHEKYGDIIIFWALFSIWQEVINCLSIVNYERGNDNPKLVMFAHLKLFTQRNGRGCFS